MSNYLPTAYQQVFYVYFHVDPESDDVVYIGSGTKERAWTARTTNRSNPDHLEWLRAMETKGYSPDEYVKIVFKCRTKREALDKETALIEELEPQFNKTLDKWWWCLSLSEDQVADMRRMRGEGMSYKNIASAIGSSTMTVWRALNGETKGYE